MTAPAACELCRRDDAAKLGRTVVWEDERWRLSTAVSGPVAGQSWLTPRRHIAALADLDADEAETLGPVLAHVSAVLHEACAADGVELHVPASGSPHLQAELTPQQHGEASGEEVAERLRARLQTDPPPAARSPEPPIVVLPQPSGPRRPPDQPERPLPGWPPEVPPRPDRPERPGWPDPWWAAAG